MHSNCMTSHINALNTTSQTPHNLTLVRNADYPNTFAHNLTLPINELRLDFLINSSNNIYYVYISYYS